MRKNGHFGHFQSSPKIFKVGNTVEEEEEDFEDESLKRFELKHVDPHSVRVMD